ncbi:MAG: hypothetical protein AAF741_04135 [Bacteroidota bacterium]
MKLKHYILLLSVAIFAACGEDAPPSPQGNDGADLDPGSGVLILNEGPFRQSLASLSFYEYETGQVTGGLFEEVNGFGLGDILQSATVIDDQLLLVVNNSSVVERVGKRSLRSNASLTLESPRYALRLPDGRFYISDFTAGEIHVVESAIDLRKSNSIPLPGWSEQMVLLDGQVWVTNPFREYVYGIDISQDLVTDSIRIDDQCGPLLTDAQGRMWTLCQGESILDNSATLYRFTPTGDIDAWPVSANGQSRMLFVDALNEMWLLTFEGLYRFSSDLSDSDEIGQLWLERSGNWYALGREPQTGDIYLGDAIDFQQPGLVYRYSDAQNPIDSFAVGLAPNGFVFY